MNVDETLLNEVVRRVLTVARPDRIILFGSAATGQMTKDSDIDLLVVEPALANTHERRVAIRGAVGDIGYPVDVLVMRTERFERTKRFIGGIAYPANKYGRVIYEAALSGSRLPVGRLARESRSRSGSCRETGSQCGNQHPPARNCRLPLPADRREMEASI